MLRYGLIFVALAGLGLLVFVNATGDEEGSGLQGTYVLDLTAEQRQDVALRAVRKSRKRAIEALPKSEREAHLATWADAVANLLAHVEVSLDLQKKGTYTVRSKFGGIDSTITGRWTYAGTQLTLTPDPGQGKHPNATEVRRTTVEGETIHWSASGADVVLRRK